MNNKQAEARLRQAVSAAAPDKLDEILRHCGAQEDNILPITQPRKKRSFARLAAGIAAAAAVLVCSVAYTDSHMVASTVSLDVNPSIQIEANRREKVLRVIPLNEDGKAVVDNMDFRGANLDVTVNALIGSMVRSGYLSEMANSILLSVDDSDPARGAQLQEKLSREIDELLQTDSFSGAVLSQTVSDDEELDLLALAYNISTGKAKLICQMTAQNSFYTEEELAELSINDLNLLNSSLDNVSYTGQASDKAYIGKDAALTAALDHAGVSPAHVLWWEAEMDYDRGQMLYDIEFLAISGKYDYEIDALTGNVLPHPEVEARTQNEQPDPGPGLSGPTEDSGLIPHDKALLSALEHAGLAQDSNLSACKYELDEDHGVPVYEIEFRYGQYEYEYAIDAQTGEVVKYQREVPFLPSGTGLGGTDFIPYVPEGGAKLSALSHAGLTEDQITDYECETDEENGHTVYEIEFKSGGYAYSYKIHGSYGLVLEHEKERED